MHSTDELCTVDPYAGEVVVMGAVKGTEYDTGGNDATITAEGVADDFWTLYTNRKPASLQHPR